MVDVCEICGEQKHVVNEKITGEILVCEDCHKKIGHFINCGERKIQKIGRIAIKDILERYGLEEGNVVEVYIRAKDI